MPTSFILPSINPSVSQASASILDPSSGRLSTLNIPSGSISSPAVTMNGNPINDRRVRVSMLPNSPAIFYNDSTNSLLQPLATTNGVLFPYQPKVDISFSASYQVQKVLQSNFAFYNYENSEMKAFDLTCDFPATNAYEGSYVIAAMTFLRALTMMFTGNDTSNNLAGSPPLIVRLLGMGFGGLDYIPVAVTNVTSSYPDNVDYITIPIPGLNNELTKIPILTTISINCVPMFSRQFASQFSALDFAKGIQRLTGPYSQEVTSATKQNGIYQSSQSVTVTANATTGTPQTISDSSNDYIQQQSISLLNLSGNN